MPNTIGHFGVQSAVSRRLFRNVDVRWILLGCVLPDVPWIIRRIVDPMLDPYASRLYFFSQAALGTTFLLCGAVSLLAARPRLVFGLLALNAVLHFLLDACQTKFGNGALLLAPLSWHEFNLGLFWPEQWPSYVFTLLGVIAVAWFWKELWSPFSLELRRWPLALLLLIAWLTLPFAMGTSAYRADLQDIRTFKENRVGEFVAVDRGAYDDRFVPWNRRPYRVTPAPGAEGLVSIEGTLTAPDEISAHRIHVHHGRARDYASLGGLALLAASLLVGLLRRQAPEC
ncbi:MAG: hypothetical protein ACYTHK_14010 [Planctomycetota bacterium]|jgi:hypothetical protein